MFHCWALSSSFDDYWSKLNSNTIVLLSPNKCGEFQFMGQVGCKIWDQEFFCNQQWPIKSGSPWDLIYTLENFKKINISKDEVMSFFGYKRNCPVQRPLLENIKSIASVGKFEGLVGGLNEKVVQMS